MTGMKNIDNKRELFPFLSRELVKLDLNGRLLISINMKSSPTNSKKFLVISYATTLRQIPRYSSILPMQPARVIRLSWWGQ